MSIALRLVCFVAISFFLVQQANGQDSVVTGASIEPFITECDSSSSASEAFPAEAFDSPPPPAPLKAASVADSNNAEREAEAYQHVFDQIARTRSSYEVPSDLGRYVKFIPPNYRQKLYDKFSRIGSLWLAAVNFFPIPFLGTIILGDEFGGNILLGASVIFFIAMLGKVSQCTDCQTTANIMLYTAAGLGIWVALRPIYLYQKNSEYNKALASVLQPPDLSFITVQPIFQHTMAGVVVPTLQVAIGF